MWDSFEIVGSFVFGGCVNGEAWTTVSRQSAQQIDYRGRAQVDCRQDLERQSVAGVHRGRC